MSLPIRPSRSVVIVLTLLLWARSAGAETFRVATYNVESYLDEATQTRSAKSVEAKAKIRESIRALKPDVLAMQEMGGTNALLELRDSLKAEGLDLPYWEHITGFDTNIHVAILSKFPIIARRPHTDDSFLLSGRRFRVSRGFAEVDIQVNTNYSFTLMTAHLKSKRAVAQADETELRLEEAKLLREKVDVILSANPNANLVVLGDFNDTKDSASTKAVIGRGKRKRTARMAAISAADRLRWSRPALARPIPCSAEIVPPKAAARRSTASSAASSAGSGPSTLTCRLPAPMCPNTITRQSGPAATRTAASSAARNSAILPSGSATSSLCGIPAALIASVCRSRYAHRAARPARSSATAVSSGSATSLSRSACSGVPAISASR